VPDKVPALQAGISTHPGRLALVRELLKDLARREELALAASAPTSHRFRWASLGPDSGLTEDQENFVDWTPTLVLHECRTKRELICALDEWALTAESSNAQELVSRLLTLMREEDVDDN
jgi:hypothetical protein